VQVTAAEAAAEHQLVVPDRETLDTVHQVQVILAAPEQEIIAAEQAALEDVMGVIIAIQVGILHQVQVVTPAAAEEMEMAATAAAPEVPVQQEVPVLLVLLGH
jgi:hypothetical protein